LLGQNDPAKSDTGKSWPGKCFLVGAWRIGADAVAKLDSEETL
jgi:hypothetical protein